jgi:hypothetical protein
MLCISFLTKGVGGEGVPIFGWRGRELVDRVLGEVKKRLKKRWRN